MIGDLPFNVPYVSDTSKRYVQEALESSYQQGDGPFSRKVSRRISDLVGGGHVLLTPSCTHALEMASMLIELGPGDEVIMPSYTFTSAATAVTKFGATPVFVDIDRSHKGIDVNQLEKAITTRTKAISWVNYAGIAPDVYEIIKIAKQHDLLTIEDNAHGLSGDYHKKPLGSFGDFATQSFHATKNLQCGEGGALIINNAKYIDRAEIIREKGTNRLQFLRGEVQKYQWVDNGSSYLLAEVLAAQLLGNLENLNEIQSKRMAVWEFYKSFFSKWESRYFHVNEIRACDKNVAHIFYLEFFRENQREEARSIFSRLGISTTFHYQSLAKSKMGKLKSRSVGDDVRTQKFSEGVLRFPIWVGIDLEDLRSRFEHPSLTDFILRE